ncbi:MAG: hypothetical protein ACUVWX_09350 [Kiritimatiellia bacterium]
MKLYAARTMAVLVLCSFFGCKSAPPAAKKTSYELLQERATAINNAGGLAAVGVGTSSQSVSLALEKAKGRGRTELAYMIETKIETLKKSFAKEIGENQAADYNVLFTAASTNVARKILVNTAALEIKHETIGGVTTAWALMVQNPKIILDAFADEAATQKERYARFRASQTFRDFEEEIRKYEQTQGKTTGEAPAETVK